MNFTTDVAGQVSILPILLVAGLLLNMSVPPDTQAPAVPGPRQPARRHQAKKSRNYHNFSK
jgi:hypothetical protein